MARTKGSTDKKVVKPNKKIAQDFVPKIKTSKKFRRPYKEMAQTSTPKIKTSESLLYPNSNITIGDFKISVLTGLPILYNSRIVLMKIRKYNDDGTVQTTYLRRESLCDPPVKNAISGPPSNAHLRYSLGLSKPMDPPGDQQNHDPSLLLRCLENEKDPYTQEFFYIDVKTEDDVYEFIDDDDKFDDLSSTSSEATEWLKPRMVDEEGREIFHLTITDRTCLYKM